MTKAENDNDAGTAAKLRLLERLNARLRDDMERERASVSRAVHDTIGQTLSAMKMQLHDIRRRPDIEPPVAAQLCELESHTETLLADARRIASDLRPGVLDHFGLQAALATTLDRFEQAHGITTEFRDDSGGVRLPRGREVALLRVIELALDNVAQHSGADSVHVRILLADGDLELTVSDDGCGFDPGTVASEQALGLLDMRTRAAAIGARLGINSKPGGGTRVRIAVPAASRERSGEGPT